MCAFRKAAEPEGRFLLRLRVIVLMMRLAAKGLLMLFWMRAIRRPFAVSGIRCLHPQAKQRVPFVRGCVPIDTDSSHDKNRVRVLKTANGLAMAGAASAHGCVSFPAEGVFAFGILVCCHKKRHDRLRIDARQMLIAAPS
ncbi:hypothetical protein AXE65_01980 [Ventosimonas gracilis]|uniref:Uncharacterized protein n=2 Tax=Ventosimonas gracilis TaxID=1680762 RepID=A0A139SUS5_9GAMM|nr:hypothetical protein AXE65_01980 [Ventosimonas gracilis]